MRNLFSMLVASALFLAAANASAQSPDEKKGMAFCDEMAVVLNAQDQCGPIGNNLKALFRKYEAFLSSPRSQKAETPQVTRYCEGVLKPKLVNLERCVAAPELQQAMMLMDEIESTARRGKPQPGKVEIPPLPKGLHPGLLDPKKATQKAPATFKVRLETTKGDVLIEVTRAWAPNGADRLYNLVKVGYFSDLAFFRAIEGFMVQFGIHGHPDINKVWRTAQMKDDPVVQSNTVGMVTFAMAGPNTRTTQFFINTINNARLDTMGFAPVGKVIKGMDVVNRLYTGYGEGAPQGRGPAQGMVQSQGNGYLRANFPNLDYIKAAHLVK